MRELSAKLASKQREVRLWCLAPTCCGGDLMMTWASPGEAPCMLPRSDSGHSRRREACPCALLPPTWVFGRDVASPAADFLHTQNNDNLLLPSLCRWRRCTRPWTSMCTS